MAAPIPLSDIERRITLRLMGYWERVRGSRLMPSESDIDPDDLADLWDDCFLVQVRDLAKSDYNFTYLGARVMEAYGEDLSTEDEHQLVAPNANRLTHSYRKVIEMRQPLVEEGEFRNALDHLVKYRQCLLPLGYDGQNVDAIFGGMRYKIFPS